MNHAAQLGAPAEPRGELQNLAGPDTFPALNAADEQRLVRMLQSHFSSVWRVGRRMGLTNAQAEENAQEAFILAAQRMRSIADGKERAYLLGTALRLASNTRRRLAHRLELSDGDDTLRKAVDERPHAESILQHKQQCDLVDRVLEAMPGILSQVFMLYELEELTLSEIAGVLEIPAGTAASRLRRAREEFSIQVQRQTANLEIESEKP